MSTSERFWLWRAPSAPLTHFKVIKDFFQRSCNSFFFSALQLSCNSSYLVTDPADARPPWVSRGGAKIKTQHRSTLTTDEEYKTRLLELLINEACGVVSRLSNGWSDSLQNPVPLSKKTTAAAINNSVNVSGKLSPSSWLFFSANCNFLKMQGADYNLTILFRQCKPWRTTHSHL